MTSTTDTAKEQAGHLAGTTQDEAHHVADEAKAQARNVMDETRTLVDEQSRTQRDRLVETARTFGGDLDQMARNGPDGMAGDLARQLAQKARELGDRLDGREPSEILDEVRDFARRRPGMFLLGAAAAGVVVGRMARGAKDAESRRPSTTAIPRQGGTTAPIEPTSPPGTPTGVPVAHPRLGEPGYRDPALGKPGLGNPGLGNPDTTATPLGDEAERRIL